MLLAYVNSARIFRHVLGPRLMASSDKKRCTRAALSYSGKPWSDTDAWLAEILTT